MTPTATENETLTYAECLAEVESFMVESGLRQFCSEVCRGQCCSNCWDTSPAACHRNEGRRISCSVHLCSGLQIHLRLNGWEYFESVIYGTINLANERLGGKKHKGIFFTVHTPKMQALCTFSKKQIAALLPCQDKRTDIRQRLLWLAQQPNRPKWFMYNDRLFEEIRRRYDRKYHIHPISLTKFVTERGKNHA